MEAASAAAAAAAAATAAKAVAAAKFFERFWTFRTFSDVSDVFGQFWAVWAVFRQMLTTQAARLLEYNVMSRDFATNADLEGSPRRFPKKNPKVLQGGSPRASKDLQEGPPRLPEGSPSPAKTLQEDFQGLPKPIQGGSGIIETVFLENARKPLFSNVF